MNWKFAFFFTLIAFIVLNCSPTQNIALDQSRTIKPSEISSFHPEITLTTGWVPYKDQKLVKTGKNEWKVVKEDGAKQGKVPILVVSFPESGDSILLDMNIENELLGKLIKHSVMTQEPIQRPFVDFFEKAKCSKCHPQHIELDFE